jgi:hypothetical protein
MIPEFNSLSEKVSRLATLTQALRQENADLRQHLSSLSNDKEMLSRRMAEAQQRIAALLEKLPEALLEPESEMAEEKAV